VIRTVKRAAIGAGVLAAAVAAIGGYSLGATAAAKPIATACVTAKHVPATLWAGSHRCPRGQHAITWEPSSAPSSPSPSTSPSPKPSPITLPTAEDIPCGGTYSTGILVTGSFDVTGPEAFTFTLTDADSFPMPACPSPNPGLPGGTYTVTPQNPVETP
jgi:hypothetical protein